MARIAPPQPAESQLDPDGRLWHISIGLEILR